MKYLNEILIEWNDSDFEDSGIIKTSDVKGRMKYHFIYKLNKSRKIKIFNSTADSFNNNITYSEYKNKVYVNGEHVQLSRNGYTVNVYEPGEYRVYIEGFDKVKKIDKYTFYQCKDLTSVIIPKSVTKIGEYAFFECVNLSSVIIPKSVTEISQCVFADCISLSSVTIPNSVTRIGYMAFVDSGLTLITIPNSVTQIGKEAFMGCTHLSSVTIPDSVTEIGIDAFNKCLNLQTIYVKDINKFKRIQFKSTLSNPTFYGAKLIQLK